MQKTIDFLRFSTGNTELFKMGEGQAGRVSVMIILGILQAFFKYSFIGMHFIEKSYKYCANENKGYDFNGFWKHSVEKFGDLSFYKIVIRTIRNVMSQNDKMDLVNWFIDWAILNKIITMSDWNLDSE